MNSEMSRDGSERRGLLGFTKDLTNGLDQVLLSLKLNASV